MKTRNSNLHLTVLSLVPAQSKPSVRFCSGVMVAGLSSPSSGLFLLAHGACGGSCLVSSPRWSASSGSAGRNGYAPSVYLLCCVEPAPDLHEGRPLSSWKRPKEVRPGAFRSGSEGRRTSKDSGPNQGRSPPGLLSRDVGPARGSLVANLCSFSSFPTEPRFCPTVSLSVCHVLHGGGGEGRS